MERVFLDWRKPLLESTADFLLERHTDASGRLDLKSVTVVLPGSRARYRLEEILATRALSMKNKAWYPPEFLTPKRLPEKFYQLKKPLANKLVRLFAWMAAIERLDAQELLFEKPRNFEDRFA